MPPVLCLGQTRGSHGKLYITEAEGKYLQPAQFAVHFIDRSSLELRVQDGSQVGDVSTIRRFTVVKMLVLELSCIASGENQI